MPFPTETVSPLEGVPYCNAVLYGYGHYTYPRVKSLHHVISLEAINERFGTNFAPVTFLDRPSDRYHSRCHFLPLSIDWSNQECCNSLQSLRELRDHWHLTRDNGFPGLTPDECRELDSNVRLVDTIELTYDAQRLSLVDWSSYPPFRCWFASFMGGPRDDHTVQTLLEFPTTDDIDHEAHSKLINDLHFVHLSITLDGKRGEKSDFTEDQQRLVQEALGKTRTEFVNDHEKRRPLSSRIPLAFERCCKVDVCDAI